MNLNILFKSNSNLKAAPLFRSLIQKRRNHICILSSHALNSQKFEAKRNVSLENVNVASRFFKNKTNTLLQTKACESIFYRYLFSTLINIYRRDTSFFI